MAQQFVASIYRFNGVDATASFSTAGNSIPALMGVSETFSPTNVRFHPIHGTLTACGVTMNAIIELLPSGLRNYNIKFYTDRTVAQLVTLANA